MNCLAGVDEAGLGPVLGPLVVAGVAMAGPEGSDPWRKLRARVCRHRLEKGRIRVADSKVVHSGPHALRHVEETALTFWGAWRGAWPANLREWLLELGADLQALARCPWYADLDLPLPVAADRQWIVLQTDLLLRSLRRTELQVLHVAVRPVDVEEFNGLIADTDNKSRAHFAAYAEVIARLLAVLPGRAHLVADRCGGRVRYGAGLRETCPGYRVRVVEENARASVYTLQRGDEPVTLTFIDRGEDHSFPTALASCFAKYLRELMVHTMNRWFRERVPDLRPTAGYFGDGRRFLADLGPHLERLALPMGRLVRVR